MYFSCVKYWGFILIILLFTINSFAVNSNYIFSEKQTFSTTLLSFYTEIPNDSCYQKESSVTDAYNSTAYTEDFKNQTDANNYTYNKIGQLTGNKQEGNQTITYNAYGTTKKISKTQVTGGLTYTPSVNFYYDANGFRIKKVEKRPNAGTANSYLTYITYYVNDAAGSPIAIYSTDGQGVLTDSREIPIYAAGRTGVATRNTTTTNYSYELSDHLGNVRVTIPRNYNGTNVQNIASYYPFGMQMPGTLHSLTGTPYRYGYQGQFAEKDPETGFNAFEARLWEARLGRWLTPDPARQYWSPYLGMGNRPMSSIDPDGRDVWENCTTGDLEYFAGGITPGGDYGYVSSGYLMDNASVIANAPNIFLTHNFSDYSRLADKWGSDRVRSVAMDFNSFIPSSGAIQPIYIEFDIISLGGVGKSILNSVSNFFAKGAAKGVTNGLSKTISAQKQARHIAGTAKSGGGFLNSIDDAQSVLNAVHSGKATFLGTSKAGHQVYRFNGVTGTNVNLGAGITGQPTNVFMIKGTTSPSVVPTSPLWKP